MMLKEKNSNDYYLPWNFTLLHCWSYTVIE